jgi:plasmid stabilization system protein ParE
MEIQWTVEAVTDLDRLHRFLADVNPRAVSQVVQNLVEAPSRLIEHRRLGSRLEGYGGRDVRRILAGQYEMRYEVQAPAIYVLRIWHGREER